MASRVLLLLMGITTASIIAVVAVATSSRDLRLLKGNTLDTDLPKAAIQARTDLADVDLTDTDLLKAVTQARTDLTDTDLP